jgi:hypothetical protein
MDAATDARFGDEDTAAVSDAANPPVDQAGTVAFDAGQDAGIDPADVGSETGPADAPSRPLDNSQITAGTARVKFCHQLTRDGKAIALTVSFGDPEIARITTTTGTCAPARGTPCVAVPVGAYPGRLLEGPSELARGTFRLVDGVDYLLWAEVSGLTGRPIVASEGSFEPGQCQWHDPLDPDAGTLEGSTDVRASDAAETGGD